MVLKKQMIRYDRYKKGGYSNNEYYTEFKRKSRNETGRSGLQT